MYDNNENNLANLFLKIISVDIWYTTFTLS